MSTPRTYPYTEQALVTLPRSTENSGPTSSFSLSYALTRPNSDPPQRLALVAHPWGRLGGSKDDRVVVAVTDALVKERYTVCRYDARGAGSSDTVAATWTYVCYGNWIELKPLGTSAETSIAPFDSGLAEAEDFSHLVEAVLLPLIPPDHPSSTPIDLLLIGYSYGSLAASSSPPLKMIRQGLTLRTRTILISYPCSVLSFLTFFKSSHYTQSLTKSTQRDKRPTLAIWGTRDQFTCVVKYEEWFRQIQEVDSERVTEGVQVEGADHFWREQGDKQRLIQTIVEWVRR
ncbi:BQ2448_3995 [Microbotryum intermedium]|uniref:BQ2448_3995 protein n=1 Tax=Microbotryum intermedium TaxID=269621 RepID=A0A238FMP5_9BASI|nr:BQ2448_3995 [Microbotryum intermedium]